jgi:pilus assembly protein CpaB
MVVLAAVGLLAVFVSILVFVSDVNANVGNKVSVVVLGQDVKAYQTIAPAMLTTQQVPEKWVSPTAVRDPAAVVGQVPLHDLAKGTFAEAAMFTDAPTVTAGQREEAVKIDQMTGVGGNIQEGDRVDIVATFAGSGSASGESGNCAVLVVQNALIIHIDPAEDSAKTDASGAFSEGKVVPVTFALSVEDTLKVAHAESFGTIRLAKRSPTEKGTTTDTEYCVER